MSDKSNDERVAEIDEQDLDEVTAGAAFKQVEAVKKGPLIAKGLCNNEVVK